MRLVHLSDPHLSPLPPMSLRDWFSKRLTGALNWYISRKDVLTRVYLDRLCADIHASSPDYIVVAGDLVNLALEEEFQEAAKWLRSLGAPENVCVVPGNHDAYVQEGLAWAAQYWDAYMRSDDKALQTECIGSKHRFPYLRFVDKCALIGVSTAIPTAPFQAVGEVDAAQMDRLAYLLRAPALSNMCRIVCMHHPPLNYLTPPHKRLRHCTKLCRLFQKAPPHLILHGHTHIGSLEYLPIETGKPLPVLGVASASNAPGRHRPPAAYNLLTVSQEKPHWHITRDVRGLSADGTRIISYKENYSIL